MLKNTRVKPIVYDVLMEDPAEYPALYQRHYRYRFGEVEDVVLNTLDAQFHQIMQIYYRPPWGYKIVRETACRILK